MAKQIHQKDWFGLLASFLILVSSLGISEQPRGGRSVNPVLVGMEGGFAFLFYLRIVHGTRILLQGAPSDPRSPRKNCKNDLDDQT